MQRSNSFIVGLGLGVAAVVAGFFALRNLPSPEEDVTDARDALLAEVDQPLARPSRALPDEARSQDCDVGERIRQAQRQSVAPILAPGQEPPPAPPGGYDHPTPESRIDAILDATTCKRAGTLTGIDTDDLLDLERSIPMLARRAHLEDERVAARAWSLRTWALGEDLLSVDPAAHGELGNRLVAAGAASTADWLLLPKLTVEERRDGAVLAAALLQRRPEPRLLAEHRAIYMLRRGLTSPVSSNVEAEELRALFGAATGWWASVADAIGAPGKALPSLPDRPVGGTRDGVDVLASLTDAQLDAWAASARHADRARLAVSILLTHDPESCPAPWATDPPTDPVTGSPARWDAPACALTLGDTRWSRPEERPSAASAAPEE